MLQYLEPIIVPDRVPFWPPQPGWYVIAIILLGLAILGVKKWLAYKRKNEYRIWALQELQKIDVKEADIRQIVLLNKLLKATALQGFPRTEVAELYGTEWMQFLEKTYPKTRFTEAPGIFLEGASYRRKRSINIKDEDWMEIMRISGEWIKGHKINRS
ncbi:DUF4381 domain-containing protein [Eudoraea sp.]|uniref:DUF4381 domain-containing protein n=1 Tax=Eudoraea sp. TaxID=1979955 RepID=UPI003C74B68E